MLEIGQIYRFPSQVSLDKEMVDGLPNFFFETKTDNATFKFQKGIHSVARVKSPDGERTPLIIVSSTPRKAGSEETPWKDSFDPDHGYVRYFGDTKDNKSSPYESDGNKTLLSLFKLGTNSEINRIHHAVPIIFVEKCSVDGRAKGNLIFQGFGVIESIELVTQSRQQKGNSNKQYFDNFVYNFCVLSLSKENEKFNWDWIRDRCNSNISDLETLRNAPESWKKWIKTGNQELHLIRRNVSFFDVVSQSEQKPTTKKREDLLEKIYRYYEKKKHEFEYLAMDVTARVINKNTKNNNCIPGWITQKSGDGGIDFILRTDIGDGLLSSVKVIVLGQAKCTDPGKGVNGRDIARTIARLKRGWIGAFVTTSYFTENVQKEVIEDSYPLLMINGAKISEIVEIILFDERISLEEYLTELPKKFNNRVAIPEEILRY